MIAKRDSESGIVSPYHAPCPALSPLLLPILPSPLLLLPAASAFFKALDTELQVAQMRLADFVAAFDLSNDTASRGLDEYEFADLVRRIMPDASEAQVGHTRG